MKRSMIKSIAVIAALGLTAAACGGDDDDSADEPADSVEEPAEEPAPETTVAEEPAEETETTVAEEPAEEPAPETTMAEEPAGEGLIIGYTLPQTGSLAAIVDALVKPIEMAQQEITEAGGSLTIIPSDDGTDVNVASASVDGLIADGVHGIIGPAATGVTLGVIDKITGSNIVQCGGSTTGVVFSTYEDNGYYFRTTPPDSLQAEVLADMMTDDGTTTAAIAAIGNDYGSGFADELEGALQARGVDVPAKVVYDENATSFDAEISELVDSGADAITIISYGEGGTLLQGMIEAGIGPSDLQIYVTDGFKDNVTADTVAPDDPAVLSGIRGRLRRSRRPMARPASASGSQSSHPASRRSSRRTSTTACWS